MKILLLNENLKKNNIELIKPRSILISIHETIENLYEKILICFENYFKTENKINPKKYFLQNLKLFKANNFLKSGNSFLTKLIFSYKSNLINFRIPAIFLGDDMKLKLKVIFQ